MPTYAKPVTLRTPFPRRSTAVAIVAVTLALTSGQWMAWWFGAAGLLFIASYVGLWLTVRLHRAGDLLTVHSLSGVAPLRASSVHRVYDISRPVGLGIKIPQTTIEGQLYDRAETVKVHVPFSADSVKVLLMDGGHSYF